MDTYAQQLTLNAAKGSVNRSILFHSQKTLPDHTEHFVQTVVPLLSTQGSPSDDY